MKWRILLELTETTGSVQTREMVTGDRATNVISPEFIGLSLAESKSILAAMQTQLVQAQTDGYCDHRRKCSHCGSRRAIKDWRTRQLTTLFGVVQVEAPRFNACRCGVASRRIVSPMAEIMPDRCTPEYERILAKMGSLAAYGRAAALMAEFLPLGHTPAIETARRRTLQVGVHWSGDEALRSVLVGGHAGSGRQAIGAPAIGSVNRGLGRRRPCEIDQNLSDAIVRGHVGLRK